MKSLTDKQAAVRAVIVRHFAEFGVAPSVREIGRQIGVRSSCSVQRHLDALERKGEITRDRYAQRSIRLAGEQPTPATKDALLAMVRDLRLEVERLRQALGQEGAR